MSASDDRRRPEAVRDAVRDPVRDAVRPGTAPSPPVESGRARKTTGPAAMRAYDFQGISGRTRAAAPKEIVQLAAFVVGEERYALDIMRIKEIINPLPITRVPKSPPFIEGVIELRGAILPVVDLRKRFDAHPGPLSRTAKYLIVAMEGIGGERWIVGLVVDKVLEVIRIARDDVRPAPTMTFGETARYFSGVCRHRDRIVMVIDLDAILSSNERITLAGMSDNPMLPSPEDLRSDASSYSKSNPKIDSKPNDKQNLKER